MIWRLSTPVVVKRLGLHRPAPTAFTGIRFLFQIFASSCAKTDIYPYFTIYRPGSSGRSRRVHRTLYQLPAFEVSISGQIWLLRQLAYPDVAKAHRVAVVLQTDWQLVIVTIVFGFLLMCRQALDFDIVLNDNAVVQHGNPGRPHTLAALVKYRTQETDIVGLPFAGLTAGVDYRRLLTINRRGLAVGVSGVLV